MPRVKGGYTTRRRRKAVLKLAKGYYGSKHTLYKTAHEQVMRSLAYAYRDRKVKKRDFRKLWITRINAACQLNDIKYSRFINGLSVANIEVNRKMLAELAVNDPKGFADLVVVAKEALANKVAAPKAETVFLKAAPKAERSANHANDLKKSANTVKAEKVEEVKVEVKAEAKEDLSAHTIAELKAMCKERGLKGYSTLKKDELIALLNA